MTHRGIDISGKELRVAVAIGRRQRLRFRALAGKGARREARAYEMVGAVRAAKSLVVPLRDVPPLPARKLERVLPGLLDAQVPVDLGGCDVAYDRNGGGYVGLVVRKADREEAEGALDERNAVAWGVVPAAWALWREGLCEFPCEASDERRAAVFVSGGAATVATGRGDVFAFASETGGEPADIVRTLRMAFGAGATGVRCVCGGEGAEAVAAALRDSSLGAEAAVADEPAFLLARGLARCGAEAAARRDGLAGPVVLDGEALAAGAARRWALGGLGLAAALLVLAAGLFWDATRLPEVSRALRRDLDQQLSHRVDVLSGYPVSARGERAVAIAKAAAERRDTAALDGLLRPGASVVLADALRAVGEARGVTVFTLRVEESALAVSGNAPDRAAAQAFGQALEALGFEASLEFPEEKGGADEGVVRFTATAQRRAGS